MNTHRKQETILVVDDEESICTLLQTGVRMAGFECHVAQSSKVALAILDEHPIDVVVADIKMPEMNGIELTHIIKANYAADVILMTGYVEDFNYEDIVEQGASDFIQKPVRIQEFIARLKRVLSERSSRADLKTALEGVKLNFNKLSRAMDGIIQAISVVVEMRDPYTAGHQQRVAQLACAIARAMGIGEEDVYALRMASVIHDLGKITVPAEILSKPGQLSALEYELVKNHVKAGYDILKQVEFPWPLAQIVLQHHERLDGSGYPNSLHAKEILMPARILAVADVFETIASHRPYRPSLGLQRAIDEIRGQRGALYDPQVADVCLDLIENQHFQFSN
jgi:putative two-component system response regulator